MHAYGRHDVGPRPTSIARVRDVLADGQGCAEREGGGVGLGRGGGSRVGIPAINTSGIFSNPFMLLHNDCIVHGL